MEIPLCTETTTSYRYRIIDSPNPLNPDMGIIDVVPEDYKLQEQEENPLSEDAKKFLQKEKQRYKWTSACYRPAPNRKENDKDDNEIYFDTGHPLRAGGQDQRFSLQFCTERQYTRRALMTRDTNSYTYQNKSAHMMHPLAADEMDPSNEDAEQWQAKLFELGAVEPCQARVSTSPDRYGLFFAYNRDPYSHLKCNPYLNELNGLKDFADAVDLEWEASFRNRHESNLDSQGLLFDIESKMKMELNWAQRKSLEDILLFGLHYDIPKDDLSDMSRDIERVADNGEEYLYSMMTIVSLRVAQRLGELNVSSQRHSISSDFNLFAAIAESTIRTGRVRVKINNTPDLERDLNFLAGLGSEAQYDHTKKEILYRPMGSQFSVGNPDTFMAAIHASFDMYEDLRKKNTSVFENALDSHKTATRARQLLIDNEFQLARYGLDHELGTLLEYSQRFADDVAAKRLLQLHCMGFPSAVMDFESRHSRRAGELKQELADAADYELKWGGSLYFNPIFRDYYTMQLAYNVMRLSSDEAFKNFGRRLERQTQPSQPYNTFIKLSEGQDKAISRLNESRRRFLKTKQNPRERSASALNYISALMYLSTYAHHLNPNLLSQTTEEVVKTFDSIAQSF